MFAVLILAVFWFAYSNGANDNFKGVATLYGSGTVSYRTALTWTTTPASPTATTAARPPWTWARTSFRR